jgi:hypothetical protein
VPACGRIGPSRAAARTKSPSSLSQGAEREYLRQKKFRVIMKSFLWSLFLPMLGLGLTTAFSREPGNVRIEFVHPERFSDFQIQGRQEITSAPIFRDNISSYLSPYVARRFPGATLTLKFTDIDLAGRLKRERVRRFNDVRFDREMGASPLRLYFDYRLTDSKGRIVSSGSKALVERDYIQRYIYYPDIEKSDTLFYEKAALSRWLNSLTTSSST